MVDVRGGLIEIFGFILALLFLVNGSTKDGVNGLTRFNDWLLNLFGFSIPYLNDISNNMFYIMIFSIVGILLMFKGKSLITLVRKIVTFGKA